METLDKAKARGTITWQAPEYRSRKKDGADWYIAVIVVALAGAISAIIFHNALFAVLIIIGAFTLIIFTLREPRIIMLTLTSQEIVIGGEKYPITSLDSFWITEQNEGYHTLIIQSKKLLLNHLSLLIKEEDVEKIRKNFRLHLPEKEIYEPLFEQIAHRLGL